MHARDELLAAGRHYDVLVPLQATSPLRTAEDIDAALEMFVRKGRASLVAVTPVTEHPIHMCTIDDDGMRHALLEGMSGTVRRQDMPPVYRTSGAIYTNDTDAIALGTSFNDNEVGFVMSAGHSVDVDDLEDFARAERSLEVRQVRRCSCETRSDSLGRLRSKWEGARLPCKFFGTPKAAVDLFFDGGVNTSLHQQFRCQNVVIFPRQLRLLCLFGM